jgi:hypothetical protein
MPPTYVTLWTAQPRLVDLGQSLRTPAEQPERALLCGTATVLLHDLLPGRGPRYRGGWSDTQRDQSEEQEGESESWRERARDLESDDAEQERAIERES